MRVAIIWQVRKEGCGGSCTPLYTLSFFLLTSYTTLVWQVAFGLLSGISDDPPCKYLPAAFPKTIPPAARERLCQLRFLIAEVTYSAGAVIFEETDPIMRALVKSFGIEVASLGAKKCRLDEACADELRAQLRRSVPWAAEVFGHAISNL